MFVAQGNQIFMNDVFLKRLTAPTITSGGNPPAFSLTPDGRLTAKNADISGNVNANSGRSTTSRLTRTAGFWENCPRTRLKAISLKQWAKLSPVTPGHRSGGHQGPLPSGFMTISRLTGKLLFRLWHSVALSMRESILIFTPHAV